MRKKKEEKRPRKPYSIAATHFFETHTPDILAPSEFIDWGFVNSRILEIRREAALLESLDKKRPKEDLIDLLQKHPGVLLVLRWMIAHAPDSLSFDDGRLCVFKNDVRVVENNANRAREIVEMFADIGILPLLQELKSIPDYLKGIFVGLQPNSRKNSRGTKMEGIVEKLISELLPVLSARTGRNIEFHRQLNINLVVKKKRVDNYILLDGEPKIAVETNFYSSHGSKASETLTGSYVDVQKALRDRGMDLIVITDGGGWMDMKRAIDDALTSLACVLNLNQARSGELDKAILRFLKL